MIKAHGIIDKYLKYTDEDKLDNIRKIGLKMKGYAPLMLKRPEINEMEFILRPIENPDKDKSDANIINAVN